MSLLDATVLGLDGKAVSLAAVLEKRAAILVFLRHFG